MCLRGSHGVVEKSANTTLYACLALTKGRQEWSISLFPAASPQQRSCAEGPVSPGPLDQKGDGHV